jgi:hypothetical protein
MLQRLLYKLLQDQVYLNVLRLATVFRDYRSGTGETRMCEYSLEYMASRPAIAGDKLVITKFPHSVTHGFCAIGKPDVAVCLLPGTELAFEENVEYRRAFPLLPNVKLNEKTARFCQTNLRSPSARHDALEFPNGKIVLLTRFCPGQRATVLQLPSSSSATARESSEAKRKILVAS